MGDGKCLVVTYHFVRNVYETPYPGIKARQVADFVGQVEYLCRYHEPLCAGHFLRYFDGECDLPSNGFYLTFDDGFRDHYKIVLPILKKYGLKAAFFPIIEPLVFERVPSVEKLRFLINNMDFNIIYEQFFETTKRLFPNVDADQFRFQEKEIENALRYARYDEPNVAHFKRVTTLKMPTEIRDKVLDDIFPRYFGPDTDFINDLYMSWSELKELLAAGMTIGGHSITHPYLPLLSSQVTEIKNCLDILGDKLDTKVDVFAYPYGAYNADTLKILRQMNCRLAFTAKCGVTCHIGKQLEVDRLDTNDLPLSSAEAPNKWSIEGGSK